MKTSNCVNSRVSGIILASILVLSNSSGIAWAQVGGESTTNTSSLRRVRDIDGDSYEENTPTNSPSNSTTNSTEEGQGFNYMPALERLANLDGPGAIKAIFQEFVNQATPQLQEALSSACRGITGAPTTGASKAQEMALRQCINLSQRAINGLTKTATRLIDNIGQQASSARQDTARTASTVENPNSWRPTKEDNSGSAPVNLEGLNGARLLLASDQKIERRHGEYESLLMRNAEADQRANQMIHQILSRQGQGAMNKQLQNISALIQNGQSVLETAKGYENATKELVLQGVSSIGALGDQMQGEEGKMTSKIGEIQAKLSTQEVLKGMSELMKDIGMSTQKAIIGSAQGVASSLSGLAKVAGSVEATVASINNTNNILANMNENQMRSLELAATALNLQQQQMKMQEAQMLRDHQNSLLPTNNLEIGLIGGPTRRNEAQEEEGDN